MRKAMWLVVGIVLLATAAMAKPPELPARADGEGRVPVYPDGDQYREPALPEKSPRPAPKAPQTGLYWPLWNLVLPPIEL